MLSSVLFRCVVVGVIIYLIILIPSVYDLGSFTRVYDLFTLVGKEYSITSPTNIVSNYFPSPTIQTVSNITYKIDASSNIITLYINNVTYTYPLAGAQTMQIVLPILLGSQ